MSSDFNIYITYPMKTNNAYKKTWHLSFIEILPKDLNYDIKVGVQDKTASLCANLSTSNFVDQNSACHKHPGWCWKAQISWRLCSPKLSDRSCLTWLNSTNRIKVCWSRIQSATNPWSIETWKYMYSLPLMIRSHAMSRLFSYTTQPESEFRKSWLFIIWYCKCNISITCIAQYFPGLR